MKAALRWNPLEQGEIEVNCQVKYGIRRIHKIISRCQRSLAGKSGIRRCVLNRKVRFYFGFLLLFVTLLRILCEVLYLFSIHIIET